MSTLRENVGDVLKASIVEALRKEVSSLRENVAEMISAQGQVALKKEYDRGWDDCMEYFWSKREIEEKEGEKNT